MAADGAPEARSAWKRGSASGFEWVSSFPSPAKVIELEARFPEVVQIPSSVLESSSACWKDKALLARTFHRWIPPEAFVREFRRAGISGDIHSVCLAHRCYIFRFENSVAKELVAGRPWVINGQPVAMEDWRPEFVSAVDSIPSALLWVRLPSLPMEYWSDAVLAAILEPAGQFLCSDPATRALNRGAFARACVLIDLRQPLRPGVRVQGWFLPSGSSSSSSILLAFVRAVVRFISLGLVPRRLRHLRRRGRLPVLYLALGWRPLVNGSPLLLLGRSHRVKPGIPLWLRGNLLPLR